MRHIDFRRIRANRKVGNTNRKGLFVSVFYSAWITLLTIFAISLSYEPLLGPDDVGIRNIVSGLYTGIPEAHTYFMKYPITKILSILYRVFPDVYWYVLFLAAVNYGCLLIVLNKFMSRVKKHRILVAWAVVAGVIILWLPFFITLEWTTAAGIAAAASIVLYGADVKRDGKQESIRYYIPASLLIFLAYNLRSTVAELAIPFFGVMVLWKLADGEKRRPQIAFVALCLALVVFSSIVDSAAYSSAEWKEADKFSESRSTMFDRFGWPDYESYQDIYQRNGITPEMYAMIKNDYNLMFTYKGVLTSENLEELAEISENAFYAKNDNWLMLKNSISKRLDAMKSQRYGVQTALIYVGFLLALTSTLYKKEYMKSVLVLCTIGGFELIWIYLFFRNRLPIHVGYSLNIIASATIMGFLWKEELPWELFKSKKVWIVVILFLSIAFGNKVVVVKKDNKTEVLNSSLFAVVKQYCDQHKENVYYRDFYSFNNTILYKERIYERDERIAPNFVPPNGWSVVLPYDNQYFPSGGQQELCSWIQSKKNIYLLVEKHRAQGACKRAAALFESRGIDCNLLLEDTIEASNGIVINVYNFQCS